MFINMLPL